MKDIGYSHKPCVRDPELESRVKEITQTWPFEEQVKPHIITSIVIVQTAYRHIPSVETKTLITIHTALAIAIDDFAISDVISHRNVFAGLCNSTAKSETGILGQLARSLAMMQDHFLAFGAATIRISTLQFINMCMLEEMTHDVELHRAGLGFVEYRRFLGGLPEAYAVFIWDKARFPDDKQYLHAIPSVLFVCSYSTCLA